jgi:hypothetical protein
MTNSLQKRADILQDRFGLKTASYLSAGAADLPYDISERLRAARVQAVSSRKVAKTQPPAPSSATVAARRLPGAPTMA